MKTTFIACVLVAAMFVGARADVGGNVQDELTYVRISRPFRNVAVDHGAIAGGLQRWKLATSDLEQHIFTIDGTSASGRVVRETFDRMTQIDPYSLRPNQIGAVEDLRGVLTLREYEDFSHAAGAARVEETPLHLIASFYRGAFAAYEVLEPATRSYGSPDRFEWRSFANSELARAIARAKSCDNGEDCAAWY